MSYSTRTRKWAFSVAFVASCLMGGSTAFGSGFALMEQSAKDLGSAYAGGAAAADDASTIFFNPAGLSRIPRAQLVGAAHGIFPVANFHNNGSLRTPPPSSIPLTGGNSNSATQAMPLAALYYSQPLSDRLRLGLGVFSPFGLITEYDSRWVGRYHGVKSELVTLTINPCLAYRVNDRLSLGVGVDVMYAKARLSNAIDFGALLAPLGLGFTPQSRDGMVTFRGDSWGAGFNVGLLYEFDPRTRVGIAYRSRIEQTLEGSAHFDGVPVPNPAFADGRVKADVTLPDSASFSVWHNFTDALAATADFTWTHWGTFNDLRIQFDNPATPDAVTVVNWQDTWRYALGLVYAPRPWTLRTGVAYDQSPVPSSTYRTPRIPDNDRYWVAGGLGYKFNDDFSVDFGYAHIFVSTPRITRTFAQAENVQRGALVGSYDAQVDIVGGQFAWNFR